MFLRSFTYAVFPIIDGISEHIFVEPLFYKAFRQIIFIRFYEYLLISGFIYTFILPRKIYM